MFSRLRFGCRKAVGVARVSPVLTMHHSTFEKGGNISLLANAAIHKLWQNLDKVPATCTCKSCKAGQL